MLLNENVRTSLQKQMHVNDSLCQLKSASSSHLCFFLIWHQIEWDGAFSTQLTWLQQCEHIILAP